MAQKRIFCVGFDLPGAAFEFVEFDSKQTLLDADIVLFEPSLGHPRFEYAVEYNGRKVLTHEYSNAVVRQLSHWRSEISEALAAGKLVIVFLAQPVEYNRYTGEKTFSGTGRSRVATHAVTNVSSYESVPFISRVTPKEGREIRIEKGAGIIAPYWSEFSAFSPYEVQIEGDFSKTVLKSKTGDRIVGACILVGAGSIFFLPPIRFDEDKFFRDIEEDEDEVDDMWTDEALSFGKRLLSSLVALHKAIKSAEDRTPEPEWSRVPEYKLTLENRCDVEIQLCSEEISRLNARKSEFEIELVRAGDLRRLLFEQGKFLENSVLEAMSLFGFDSMNFSDGDSEFDGIFVSQEGRCLGEIEGRDNKEIHIDKFSQLERNLQEDFARDEVNEYAKGLLFGNAFRLMPLEDRKDFFTLKCRSAAKRVGVALIRTPDMFFPAKYLKENPDDIEFAASCRKAIFSSNGCVVEFPIPPSEGS